MLNDLINNSINNSNTESRLILRQINILTNNILNLRNNANNLKKNKEIDYKDINNAITLFSFF